MHQFGTAVIAILALFSLAIASTDPKEHHPFQRNSTLQTNITIFTFDVKSVKVKLPGDNESSAFDLVDLRNANFKQSSEVNTTDQEFKLPLPNAATVTFSFVHNETEKMYFLEHVEYTSAANLTRNETQLYFDAIDPDMKVTNNKFKIKQGYKCGNLKLTLQDDKNSTAELEFVDITFIAFQNSTLRTTYTECRQEPGSSIIPLAVGGALLVFMGVALIVYIFMRNRSG